jgi:hypothetical protein
MYIRNLLSRAANFPVSLSQLVPNCYTHMEASSHEIPTVGLAKKIRNLKTTESRKLFEHPNYYTLYKLTF